MSAATEEVMPKVAIKYCNSLTLRIFRHISISWNTLYAILSYILSLVSSHCSINSTFCKHCVCYEADTMCISLKHCCLCILAFSKLFFFFLLWALIAAVLQCLQSDKLPFLLWKWVQNMENINLYLCWLVYSAHGKELLASKSEGWPYKGFPVMFCYVEYG